MAADDGTDEDTVGDDGVLLLFKLMTFVKYICISPNIFFKYD